MSNLRDSTVPKGWSSRVTTNPAMEEKGIQRAGIPEHKCRRVVNDLEVVIANLILRCYLSLC